MYIWTVVVEDLLYVKIRNAVREKNGIMWEKFPNRRGESDTNLLLDVYLGKGSKKKLL